MIWVIMSSCYLSLTLSLSFSTVSCIQIRHPCNDNRPAHSSFLLWSDDMSAGGDEGGEEVRTGGQCWLHQRKIDHWSDSNTWRKYGWAIKLIIVASYIAAIIIYILYRDNELLQNWSMSLISSWDFLLPARHRTNIGKQSRWRECRKHPYSTRIFNCKQLTKLSNLINVNICHHVLYM